MVTTPTQAEIAKKLGVSRQAVGLALGNYSNSRIKVSPSTRERIVATARQLGYRPHPLASGLRGSRTHTVGILWALGGMRASGMMSRDVALRMQRHGYVTNLADHLGDVLVTRQVLSDLATRKVEGVILQGSPELLGDAEIIQRLQQFPAAVVVAFTTMDLPVDLVVQDRGAAVSAAVDHLMKSGRTRLVFVGQLIANQSKLNPLQARAKEHGLQVGDAGLVNLNTRDGDSEEGDVVAALEARWRGRPDCDAILCSNDVVAAFTLTWLKGKGVRVPEDVALVGFDNDPFARHLTPPLASVERREKRVADLLETMMLRRLGNKGLPPQREQVAMEFVWRESAGGQTECQ